MYKVDYTDKDYERFLQLSKEGVVAAFIYSENVLKSGAICHYDDADKKVRAIVKNGDMMVPVSFFKRFFNK